MYGRGVLRHRVCAPQFWLPPGSGEYLQRTHRVQLRGVWFSRLREHYQPRYPGSYIRRNSHAVVKRELREAPGDRAILVPGAKPVVDADHTANTEKRTFEHGLSAHSLHSTLTSPLSRFHKR